MWHKIIKFYLWTLMLFTFNNYVRLQKPSSGDNPTFFNIGGVLSNSESEKNFSETIAVSIHNSIIMLITSVRFFDPLLSCIMRGNSIIKPCSWGFAVWRVFYGTLISIYDINLWMKFSSAIASSTSFVEFFNPLLNLVPVFHILLNPQSIKALFHASKIKAYILYDPVVQTSADSCTSNMLENVKEMKIKTD